MVSIDYLKREHEEIFRSLIDFESEINNGQTNHFNLAYHLNKTIDLILYHRKNHNSLFSTLNGKKYESVKEKLNRVKIDPRTIKGHIIVISGALNSRNQNDIKVALENDGRMLISKIKEHIFNEEKILDELLFLSLLPQNQQNRIKVH